MKTSILILIVILLTISSCVKTGSSKIEQKDTPSNDTENDETEVVGAQAFALMDSGDGTSAFNQYLALSTVDGIAIRLSWDSIQPSSEGSYDWTKIDQAFSSAVAVNKKVTLHILSSVYGTTPSWVYTAGATSYTYNKFGGGTKTDPIPWNSVYLTKWSGFLTSLKAHLDANNYTSSLEYLSVGAPVPEMSLVGCIGTDINGTYAGVVTYNRTSYLNSWKTSILATHNTFPSTKLLLPAPVANVCFADNDGPAFYKDVFEYAYSLSTTLFYHYATDLKATGTSGSGRIDVIPTSPTDIKSMAPIALQYTWSYTQDNGVKLGGTFEEATCEKGIQILNGKYFEVYKQDLLNSDTSIQNAVEAIKDFTLCP